MSRDDDPIVVECDLQEPPEKVWRALTEPELRDAWLTDGEPGVSCEVLETRPERSVRLAWRDGGPIDSEVSVEITRTDGGGTHLRLVHSVVTPAVMALPPAARMEMKWAA